MLIYSRRRIGQKLEDPNEIEFYQNNIYYKKNSIFHLTPRAVSAREIVYMIIITYCEHKEEYDNSEEFNFSGTITSTKFRKIVATFSRVLAKLGVIEKPMFWDDRILFYQVIFGLLIENVLGSFTRRGIGQPAWILKFRVEKYNWIKQHPFVNKKLLAWKDWNDYLKIIIKKQEADWAEEKKKLFKRYPHLEEREPVNH